MASKKQAPAAKGAAKAPAASKAPAKAAAKAPAKAPAKAAAKAPAKTAAKAPAKAPTKAPAKAAAKAPAKAPAKAAAKAPAKAPAKKTAPKAAEASTTTKRTTNAEAGDTVTAGKTATKAEPTGKGKGKGKAPAPAGAGLDKAFLEQQRAALVEERARYLKSAVRLQAEAEALVEGREPGDVQFDEESGEGDTIAVERERDLALSAQARQAVTEIDAALARIDDGTYGICQVSGLPIPPERLEAIPWARERVEYKAGGIGRR